MPLALECEWGNDTEILYDFQRLLSSRAALRVMVFGENNRDTDQTFDLLRAQIKGFQDGMPADRYLLAGFDYGGFKILLIDGNGKKLPPRAWLRSKDSAHSTNPGSQNM